MDHNIDKKIVSSNIVGFPLANKVFTLGEYKNFFSKSPSFTWKEYNDYKNTLSRCYRDDYIKLEDIITFK